MRYALIKSREDGTEYIAEERDMGYLPTGGKVLREQGTKRDLREVGVKQVQQGTRWEQQGVRSLLEPDTLAAVEIPNMVEVPNLVDVPDMAEVDVPAYVEVDESTLPMVKHVNGKPMLRPIVIEADPYRPRIHTRTVTETIEPARVLRRYVSALRPIEEARDALARTVRAQAQAMLAPTDWYVIRRADVGTAIPAPVVTYRDAVRDACDGIEQEIYGMDLAALADYDWAGDWPAQSAPR